MRQQAADVEAARQATQQRHLDEQRRTQNQALVDDFVRRAGNRGICRAQVERMEYRQVLGGLLRVSNRLRTVVLQSMRGWPLCHAKTGHPSYWAILDTREIVWCHSSSYSGGDTYFCDGLRLQEGNKTLHSWHDLATFDSAELAADLAFTLSRLPPS